jgi:hypothetical protein
MDARSVEALERARRLAQMGVEVRSAELLEHAKTLEQWSASGGNRALRRAARRSLRRRGR